MRAFVAAATLLLAAGLSREALATTPVPSGSTSTIVAILPLGGFTAAGADPLCECVMIIRDIQNNPIPSSVVTIDFSACAAGEVRLGSVAHHPGLIVNCAAKTVSAVTNAMGIATFRIIGASNLSSGNEPGVGDWCATVRADGVLLASISVATPDFNGASGLPLGPGIDGLDTALFARARYSAYRSTANFIGPPGTLDGQDTAAFARFRFGSGSLDNGPFCP